MECELSIPRRKGWGGGGGQDKCTASECNFTPPPKYGHACTYMESDMLDSLYIGLWLIVIQDLTTIMEYGYYLRGQIVGEMGKSQRPCD